MSMKVGVKLFEQEKVRTDWAEKDEKWKLLMAKGGKLM